MFYAFDGTGSNAGSEAGTPPRLPVGCPTTTSLTFSPNPRTFTGMSHSSIASICAVVKSLRALVVVVVVVVVVVLVRAGCGPLA